MPSPRALRALSASVDAFNAMLARQHGPVGNPRTVTTYRIGEERPDGMLLFPWGGMGNTTLDEAMAKIPESARAPAKPGAIRALVEETTWSLKRDGTLGKRLASKVVWEQSIEGAPQVPVAAGANPAQPGRVVIFAMGLPGAGKSTIIHHRYGNHPDYIIISADSIAERFPEFDPQHPERTHQRAHAMADAQYEAALAEGSLNLIFDSTGARVPAQVARMEAARKAGYGVRILYVTVPLEVALERNRLRPRTVPESVIIEKAATIWQAWEVLKPLADAVEVVDTSGPGPVENSQHRVSEWFEERTWLDLYREFTRQPRRNVGPLTGRGVRNPARLRRVVQRFITGVQAGYPPVQIVAEMAKGIVGEPLRGDKDDITFEDGNRRMSMIYATHILDAFGYTLKVPPERGQWFRDNVRFISDEDVERFFRSHAIARRSAQNASSRNRSSTFFASSSDTGQTMGGRHIITHREAAENPEGVRPTGPTCGKRFRRTMREAPGSRICTLPPHEGHRHSDRGHLPPPKESTTPIGTCQVCFKGQRCPGGVLALHGYKRPGHGWIEGRCWGAGYPPFEVSCERTKAFVAELQSILVSKQAYLNRLYAGEVEELLYFPHHASWAPAPPPIRVKKGTAATLPLYQPGRVPSYQELLEQAVSRMDREIKMVGQDVREYEAKVAAWKPEPWPQTASPASPAPAESNPGDEDPQDTLAQYAGGVMANPNPTLRELIEAVRIPPIRAGPGRETHWESILRRLRDKGYEEEDATAAINEAVEKGVIAEPVLGKFVVVDEVAGPLLAAEPQREPWEMTRVDYLRSLGHDPDLLPKDGLGRPRHVAGDAEHKVSVADAVALGKPVPPEVLGEYPDLQRATPAQAPAPEGAAPAKPEWSGRGDVAPDVAEFIEALTPDNTLRERIARWAVKTGADLRGPKGKPPVGLISRDAVQAVVATSRVVEAVPTAPPFDVQVEERPYPQDAKRDEGEEKAHFFVGDGHFRIITDRFYREAVAAMGGPQRVQVWATNRDDHPIEVRNVKAGLSVVVAPRTTDQLEPEGREPFLRAARRHHGIQVLLAKGATPHQADRVWDLWEQRQEVRGNPHKTYFARYRWRSPGGRLEEALEPIDAPSLAAAKRMAKARQGVRWLIDVEGPDRGNPATAKDPALADVGPAGKRVWRRWLKLQRMDPSDTYLIEHSKDYRDSRDWFLQLYRSGQVGKPLPWKPSGMPFSFPEERMAVEAGTQDGPVAETPRDAVGRGGPKLHGTYVGGAYNEAAKADWKRASMRFLRAVAVGLKGHGFDQIAVSFDEGGIAVSGDARLFAARTALGQGVEAFASLGGALVGPNDTGFMYRWAVPVVVPPRRPRFGRPALPPGYRPGATGPNRWVRPDDARDERLDPGEVAVVLAREAESTPGRGAPPEAPDPMRRMHHREEMEAATRQYEEREAAIPATGPSRDQVIASLRAKGATPEQAERVYLLWAGRHAPTGLDAPLQAAATEAAAGNPAGAKAALKEAVEAGPLKEKVADAAMEGEKASFGTKEYRTVALHDMPFIHEPWERVCEFMTICYSSDKEGKTQTYFHPWKDGTPRWVWLAPQSGFLIAYGPAQNTDRGLDDVPIGADRHRTKGQVFLRQVKVWSRLFDLEAPGFDLPCASCGKRLDFDPKERWRCPSCGGKEPAYRTVPWGVWFDPQSQTVIAVARGSPNWRAGSRVA